MAKSDNDISSERNRLYSKNGILRISGMFNIENNLYGNHLSICLVLKFILIGAMTPKQGKIYTIESRYPRYDRQISFEIISDFETIKAH